MMSNCPGSQLEVLVAHKANRIANATIISPSPKLNTVGRPTPASGRAVPPGVGEIADISPPVVGVGVFVAGTSVGVGVSSPPLGGSVGDGVFVGAGHEQLLSPVHSGFRQ